METNDKIKNCIDEIYENFKIQERWNKIFDEEAKDQRKTLQAFARDMKDILVCQDSEITRLQNKVKSLEMACDAYEENLKYLKDKLGIVKEKDSWEKDYQDFMDRHFDKKDPMQEITRIFFTTYNV